MQVDSTPSKIRKDCSKYDSSIRLGAVSKYWCAPIMDGCMVQKVCSDHALRQSALAARQVPTVMYARKFPRRHRKESRCRYSRLWEGLPLYVFSSPKTKWLWQLWMSGKDLV